MKKMQPEGKTQNKKQQTKEYPQPSNTIRRPNSIAVGTVIRSAAAQSPKQTAVKQQQNTEWQSKPQDEKQQNRQRQSDQQNKQQQNEKQQRKQQNNISGGLGDLVKSAKASGLRKDLKVAPKKEKQAPPVNYEEGWVAIGDLSETS